MSYKIIINNSCIYLNVWFKNNNIVNNKNKINTDFISINSFFLVLESKIKFL